ncbi:GNAT family N-acetyltransferase [Variovorax sp. J22R133]|uniref:GNAT family N-acetyltransferase n=1 Tax=Variovorax brevis TaxID=3053503 RepID=UPI00257794C7|nr:GNAT family N-acetyltransferase [Variovorax sp. J22R133]MDM0112080.1 GNAT family N-acetyltransferase [Variovorax sp. J22R133]
MFELAPERYASLNPLMELPCNGAEVANAVLSGRTQGKVFISAPNDFRSAFFYDNGFCVLAGECANAAFARASVRWLQARAPQDFFVLYPGHGAWVEVLDAAISPSTRKRQRFAFEFDHFNFRVRRTKRALPPGFSMVPIDAALMRKAEATLYPWMGGTWKSAIDFEQNALGFCVLADEQVVSLCYSVFVAGKRHVIDILTAEPCRHLGLAKMVATAFIDECLRRGLQPAWDCFEHNVPSRWLAHSLGFSPASEFPVYSWQRTSDPAQSIPEGRMRA